MTSVITSVGIFQKEKNIHPEIKGQLKVKKNCHMYSIFESICICRGQAIGAPDVFLCQCQICQTLLDKQFVYRSSSLTDLLRGRFDYQPHHPDRLSILP